MSVSPPLEWVPWINQSILGQVELPHEFRLELDGIKDGAGAAGVPNDGAIIGRVITLANAPGDVKDFLLVLLDEWRRAHPGSSAVAEAAATAAEAMTGGGYKPRAVRGMCSMFGAWGSRTVDGALFTGRNLDWNQNTGINKWKLVTVHHPPEPGKHPHATLGYVGLWGTAKTQILTRNPTTPVAIADCNAS